MEKCNKGLREEEAVGLESAITVAAVVDRNGLEID